MPEFRTYVMRSHPAAAPHPAALSRALRLCAWAGAMGVAGFLSLDLLVALAADASQFLRALPWLAASWH